MKKTFVSGVIFFMSLVLFSLVSCNQPKKDKGLKGVFDNSSGEVAPPIWCDFTSEKSRLKVGEDLTIILYYAPQSDFNSIYMYDPLPTSVSAEVLMAHAIYTRNLLQKGEYTHSKPEYTFNYEIIEQFTFKEIDNFSDLDHYPVAGSSSTAAETIVVPSDWFVGEVGGIIWSVKVQLTWAETEIETQTQSGSVVLYYKIEGENIILYDSYYNFSNDIRK